MKHLSERRKILSLKFAKKAAKHPIYSKWFIKKTKKKITPDLRNLHTNQSVGERKGS